MVELDDVELLELWLELLELSLELEELATTKSPVIINLSRLGPPAAVVEVALIELLPGTRVTIRL